MTLRVVVDTNVFVGACLGTGAANAVLIACLEGRLQPLMGAALFSEHEDLLGREALFKDCRLAPAERSRLFDIYLSCCEWVRVYYAWRPNLRDEADNHLVELAVAGAAHCIVTRNLRDLQRMELRFPALRVVNPETLVKELSP